MKTNNTGDKLTITCPKCNADFALSEAVLVGLRERMTADLEAELQQNNSALAEREQLARQKLDKLHLKLADRDYLIKGLEKKLNDSQQIIEQGSVQAQGEALEIQLESELKQAFNSDEITEVKKGQRGADIIQQVRTNTGMDCGTILWEAKRARNWTKRWTTKLKDNQREAGAEMAILVSTCLPSDLRGAGMHDGVWVCEPAFAVVIATALRTGLVQTALQRSQVKGRKDKMTMLYEHICSAEFQQQFEGMIDACRGMKEQLASEQRAYARQWKEREQQINKAIQHLGALFGGMQGIAGREALPEISCLQLPFCAQG